MKKGRALLLSCMDLRVIDETAWLMQELGLHNKYDHVAIAGGALGVLTASYKSAGGRQDARHFGKTFWSHVDLAVALHEVEKVIIVEHADCGAYQHFVKGCKVHAPGLRKPPAGLPTKVAPPKSEAELQQHDWFSQLLKKTILTRYANAYTEGKGPTNLDVEIYLVTPWQRLPRRGRG